MKRRQRIHLQFHHTSGDSYMSHRYYLSIARNPRQLHVHLRLLTRDFLPVPRVYLLSAFFTCYFIVPQIHCCHYVCYLFVGYFHSGGKEKKWEEEEERNVIR